MATRLERLLPQGIPRWIRCYDNGGESWDRYTVVYTGRWAGKARGYCYYVAMSSMPFNPQGFCQHGEVDDQIDRPRYSHLGKKIKFTDLPADCQKAVMQDYKALWGL